MRRNRENLAEGVGLTFPLTKKSRGMTATRLDSAFLSNLLMDYSQIYKEPASAKLRCLCLYAGFSPNRSSPLLRSSIAPWLFCLLLRFGFLIF